MLEEFKLGFEFEIVVFRKNQKFPFLLSFFTASSDENGIELRESKFIQEKLH